MGGGASKAKTKQQSKETEQLEIQRRKDKAELLASLKVDKDQKGNQAARTGREEQRQLENKFYKEPIGSPERNENIIMDVLPDYMLNKAAYQHTEEIKQRKVSKQEQMLQSEADYSGRHQGIEKSTAQPTDPHYDAFASSIKYSLGLASIMNKYNISSTNEMTDYKNNDIFIKTKKADEHDQATNTLIFVNRKEKDHSKLS